MKSVLIFILIISLVLFSGCAKSTDTITDNPFFFNSNVTESVYKANILFDDIIEEDVKLHINEVDNLKYGTLYELKIDSIEGVPDERLNLGYFVVQQDKIYKVDQVDGSIDRLKVSKEVPKDSIIVCQDKELRDILNENEAGWHKYVMVNGDKREYHSYNNQVETGYFESFIWEKNKGLVYYISGYGAESDSIELELINP